MSDTDLEARWAAIRQRVKEEFGSELDIALTIGKVNVTRLYRIRRLDDAETIGESLDTIERVIELPSFATLAHAEAHLTSIETALQNAEGVFKARLEEYNIAREQFDIDTDKDFSPAFTELIQKMAEDTVQLEVDDLEEDREEAPDEAEAESTEGTDAPDADWSGGESES